MSADTGPAWLAELFGTPAPEGAPADVPSVPVQAPAPAAKPAPRHFYRCVGCLDVCTAPARLPMSYSVTVAECGTCGQHLEYMGRAGAGDRLVEDRQRCACDERCTSARGPLCVCHCGGLNHGAGLAAVVVERIDRGAVPLVTMPSAKRAAKLRASWLEFQAAREALRAELDALLERRARGEYLPRPAFDRLREIQRITRKADGLRSHAGRMKALSGA